MKEHFQNYQDLEKAGVTILLAVASGKSKGLLKARTDLAERGKKHRAGTR